MRYHLNVITRSVQIPYYHKCIRYFSNQAMNGYPSKAQLSLNCPPQSAQWAFLGRAILILGSRTHLAFIFLVSLLLKSWLQKRTAKQDACVRDNIISKSTRLPSNIEARGWSWLRDLEIEKAILVWRLRKLSLFKLRKLFLRYSESIPLIEIWESNSCLTFEK